MTDFDCCVDTENDTAPTTTWRKGGPTADLIRLLERAAEAGVRVTASFGWEEATEVHSSVPRPAGGDYWIVGSRYVNTPHPHQALTSVTSHSTPEEAIQSLDAAEALTAEPTEAEMEAGAKEIWRWFVGSNLEGFYRHAYAYDREKCMDACRAALKAAREVRR